MDGTKRIVASALLAGVTIAGAGGITGAVQHASAARAGTQHVAAARGQHIRQLSKQLHARMQLLTVTSVSGTTISAKTRNGVVVTVNTSSTTMFKAAGATVALSAILPGAHIVVRGALDRATHTVAATAVQIVVPTTSGVVTKVEGSTITLTGRNAVQHTFTLGSGARIEEAGQAATLQAIAVGSLVTVQDTTSADGSVTVLRVVVRLPRVAGTISAVSGASFTLHTLRGTSVTVTTSTATSYILVQRGAAPKKATTPPALATGERVLVVGTLSADGNTIAAARIAVAPAAAAATTGTSTGASA